MYRLFLFCFILLLSCQDSDPGFTSPEGKWSYTTPDGKIAVTFDVIKALSGSFDIQNQTLKIDNVSANAEKEVVGFTSTTIEKIRINANDSKAVYPYTIVFNNSTISSDYNQINVPTVTYTYPWGTTSSLTGIIITRL